MIGRGTPNIQSNMPRPIGSLLLKLFARDFQTVSTSISSCENSMEVVGPTVVFRQDNNFISSGQGGRVWS